MILIDTHAHVNFSAFKQDADEVIRRSLNNNTWIINVGSQYSTSKKGIALAEKYKEGVYAAIGLHPIHSADGFDYEKYRQLAQSPGVVAIGETGLDYKEEYVSFTRTKQSTKDEALGSSPKEKQKQVFLQQLNLAREINLPIIFHCRMAHNDLLEILNSQITDYNLQPKGVVHCFTGNRTQAEKYLATGLYLGFNGIIFKLNLNEIIKKTPLDKILIETDCPYLTPPQIEGRNEPLHVKHIAEKIAQIKNIISEEVIKTTTENAKKLFKI